MALPTDPFSPEGEEPQLDHTSQLIVHTRTEQQAEVIWDLPQTNFFHNGGTVHFSPLDGSLYVATGDDGPQGKGATRPQDSSNSYGKILNFKIDQLQREGPALIALGFRNPWSFTFSKDGHHMLVGDVGFHRRESVYAVSPPEITHPTKEAQKRRRARGLPLLRPNVEYYNAGWPIFEGTLPFAENVRADHPPIAPIFEYDHEETGGSAITGVAFVDRDSKVLFCDYTGLLGLFDLETSTMIMGPVRVFPLGHYIKGMMKDSLGQVYLTVSQSAGLQGNTGTLYRVHLPFSEPQDMSIDISVCKYCGEPQATYRCSTCDKVVYCNVQCATEDTPVHGEECG